MSIHNADCFFKWIFHRISAAEASSTKRWKGLRKCGCKACSSKHVSKVPSCRKPDKELQSLYGKIKGLASLLDGRAETLQGEQWESNIEQLSHTDRVDLPFSYV